MIALWALIVMITLICGAIAGYKRMAKRWAETSPESFSDLSLDQPARRVRMRPRLPRAANLPEKPIGLDPSKICPGKSDQILDETSGKRR
jgi:hypothetical protein